MDKDYTVYKDKDGKVTGFVPTAELEIWENMRQKAISYMLWGLPSDYVPPTPEQQYLNDLKWAWVVTIEGRKLLWVNNKDMKAYKEDGSYGVIKPLEEVPYIEFARWATTFDL